MDFRYDAAMNRKLLLLPPTALLFSLTACGIGNFGTIPAAPGTPLQTATSITGNWQIQTATSPAGVSNTVLLLGALQSNGTSVTGTFRLSSLVQANTCGQLNQVITVTGTFSTANTLSLTSAPFASGSVLKTTLQVPATPNAIGSGTLEIDGGACAYASGSALGGLIAPVSGTYLGTLTGQTGTSTTPASPAAVTLVLTQASTPAADGQFALTGSLQAVTSCTTNTSVTGTASGVGVLLASAATGSLPSPSVVSGIGAVLPTAKQFQTFNVFYSPAPCATSSGVSSGTASYTGTLTRQ